MSRGTRGPVGRAGRGPSGPAGRGPAGPTRPTHVGGRTRRGCLSIAVQAALVAVTAGVGAAACQQEVRRVR